MYESFSFLLGAAGRFPSFSPWDRGKLGIWTLAHSFSLMKDQKTFLEIKKRRVAHISQTLSEQVLLALEICWECKFTAHRIVMNIRK